MWAKNYNVPFRSNLKIYENIIFAANQNNNLFFFDKQSGEILKQIPTEETIVKNNFIKATRVVLPVSESASIPSRFGLRHRAAIGISEKTDAVVLVISEQSGKISYIKDGIFCKFKSIDDLMRILNEDLSL